MLHVSLVYRVNLHILGSRLLPKLRYVMEFKISLSYLHFFSPYCFIQFFASYIRIALMILIDQWNRTVHAAHL